MYNFIPFRGYVIVVVFVIVHWKYGQIGYLGSNLLKNVLTHLAYQP